MISNILPNVQAKDFEITDVQAYQNGAEVVPTEDITFQLNVDPEATVTLYRLNADGELVAEPLKVTDGIISVNRLWKMAYLGYAVGDRNRSCVRIVHEWRN